MCYFCRSRRGGIKLSKYESSDENNDNNDNDAEESEEIEVDEGRDSSSETPKEDDDAAAAAEVPLKEKPDSSRIDDLWASFKQDVGVPPKEEKNAGTSSGVKVRKCGGCT